MMWWVTSLCCACAGLQKPPPQTSPATATAALRMMVTSCRCEKTLGACSCGIRCLAPNPSRTAKEVRQRSARRNPALKLRNLLMGTPPMLVKMAKHGCTTGLMAMGAHRLIERADREGR